MPWDSNSGQISALKRRARELHSICSISKPNLRMKRRKSARTEKKACAGNVGGKRRVASAAKGYPKGRRRELELELELETRRARMHVRCFVRGGTTRSSIRFGDKERGLRDLVKCAFDASGARQKGAQNPNAGR